MDSLGFKKYLFPPLPLGYFQTPLGESLNSEEILSFSVDKQIQPFTEGKNVNSQKPDFSQIQNKKEISVNSELKNTVNKTVASKDINANYSSDREAVTENIVLRKPLGQSSLLVKSDFPSNLVQEFLSSEIQLNSRIAQFTNPDNLNESLDQNSINLTNPVFPQTKSEPTSIQNKSTLINLASEKFDSEKFDIQPQQEIITNSENFLPVKTSPQIIENTSIVLPSMEATSNDNTTNSQQSDSNITSKPANLPESQSFQPQLNFTSSENISIDRNSTVIQPQLENHTQQTNVPQSQQIESLSNETSNLAIAKNIQPNLQQPVEPQSIATPQKPQLEDQTQQIESLSNETSNLAIAENIQPNFQQQPIEPQLENHTQQTNLPQSQEIESLSNETSNSAIAENIQPNFQQQPIEPQLENHTQQTNLPQSQEIESLSNETSNSAIAENIQPNFQQQPIEPQLENHTQQTNLPQSQEIESLSNETSNLTIAKNIQPNLRQPVEPQSIATPQKPLLEDQTQQTNLPQSQEIESLSKETSNLAIALNIQPNLQQQPVEPQLDSTSTENISVNRNSTVIQPQLKNQTQQIESLSNETSNSAIAKNIQRNFQQQPVESQSFATPQKPQLKNQTQQIESLSNETSNSAIADNIQPNLQQQPVEPQLDSTSTENIIIARNSPVIQPQLENKQQVTPENRSESQLETPTDRIQLIQSKKTNFDLESVPSQLQLEQPSQNIQPNTKNNFTLEQKQNHFKTFSKPDDKLDNSKSELPEILPSNPNDIQTPLDDRSLPILKSLIKSSPLAKESDFIISTLTTDFSEEIPLKSDYSNIVDINNRLMESDAQLIDEESKNPKVSQKSPEEWSNISELLNATSQLSSTDNLVPRNLSIESELSQEQSKVDNFNALSQNKSTKISDPWTNISQLIGENHQLASLNNINSSTYTLSENTSILPSSISENNNITSEIIRDNLTQEDDFINEKKLEYMAQKIYSLLQQRLEIDCERQGKNTLLYQTNFNQLAHIQKDLHINSIVDNQLQALTQEVYIMLQQRIQIERERSGS